MEHESDDDVLIIEDETADQIQVELKVEPDTEDLFRQIDEKKKKKNMLFCSPTPLPGTTQFLSSCFR